MKLKSIFAFLIFTTLLGTNYQSSHKSKIISQSVSANGLKNQVVKLEGSASLKRGGRNERPLTSGERVNFNDEIIKPQDSQITILCTDGTLWYVPDGTSVVQNGCLNTNRTNDTNLKQPTNTNAF